MTTPTFPGLRPRRANLRLISYPSDVLRQFQEDWATFSTRNLTYLHLTFRHLAGFPGTNDFTAVNDSYRTSRFDLASHYNRALDPTEPYNLTSVDQITHSMGRRLSCLLEQLINLQQSFGLQALHSQPQDLLPLLQVAQQLTHLLAVAYHRQLSDPLIQSEGYYQSFTAAVAADPELGPLAIDVTRSLNEHGVMSKGIAQDLISLWIVLTVDIIHREIKYISQARPKKFLFLAHYPQPSFEVGAQVHELDGSLREVGSWLARLMWISTGRGPSFEGLAEQELRWLREGM